jgi:hypothetical protein
VALAALIVIGLGLAISQQSSSTPSARSVPALASPPTDMTDPSSTLQATATLVEVVADDAAAPSASPIVESISSPPTQAPQSTNTLRPTATLRPTSTPRPLPSDTPVPTCKVTGQYAGLWAQLQSRLGCSTGSAQTIQGAAQVFERGRMYWRSDKRVIYAVIKGGRWEAYGDLIRRVFPFEDLAVYGVTNPVFVMAWETRPQTNTPSI